jgi:hypothetical protein
MKKVYSNAFSAYPASVGVKASLDRLGVAVTQDKAEGGITHVMPLADAAVNDCVQMAAALNLPYMTEQTKLQCSDKFLMTQLPSEYGVKTLKTVVPMSAADLDALPDAPMLVKKRRTYTKVDAFSFSYKVFPNRAALLAELGEAFWAYQENPDLVTGEYVAQEAGDAGDYAALKVVHFAINGQSQALRVRNTDVRYLPGNSDIFDAFGHDDFTDIEGQMSAIERVVAGLGIKNALMSVQFVKKGADWYLMDWNFRPGMFMFMVTAIKRPDIFDEYMAHMLDIAHLPVARNDVMYYRKVSAALTDEVAAAITACGLAVLPSDQMAAGPALYVYDVGATKQELLDKFDTLEATLNAPA